jgi:PadR family transcriptional regulator, regulatory protein AphA
MPRLTPTSFAILGLLAIQPRSSYELTKLLGRSVQYVMPRTEANRYQEPKRLVEAGLATAEEARVGQRPRTVYSITPAGREALVAWLQQPARPTQLESEALLKVLFANMAPLETLLARINDFGAEAEAVEAPWRAIAQEYANGEGPFPERTHINALFWVLLDRWARLRAEWARWAAKEVESWPDEHGPIHRESVQVLLTDMLAGRWGPGFPDRPSSSSSGSESRPNPVPQGQPHDARAPTRRRSLQAQPLSPGLPRASCRGR